MKQEQHYIAQILPHDGMKSPVTLEACMTGALLFTPDNPNIFEPPFFGPFKQLKALWMQCKFQITMDEYYFYMHSVLAYGHPEEQTWNAPNDKIVFKSTWLIIWDLFAVSKTTKNIFQCHSILFIQFDYYIHTITGKAEEISENGYEDEDGDDVEIEDEENEEHA